MLTLEMYRELSRQMVEFARSLDNLREAAAMEQIIEINEREIKKWQDRLALETNSDKEMRRSSESTDS